MQTSPRHYLSILIYTWCLAVVPLRSAVAEPVDFSCMREFVRSKTQVTDIRKEYDAVVHNYCPGPVYWAMCIERIDPASQEILEVHTPNGYVRQEKFARVNLQLKVRPEDGRMDRFQQLYVRYAYSVDETISAPCSALECTANNRELVSQLANNERAWLAARNELEQRIAQDCIAESWAPSEDEDCESALREAQRDSLEEFARTEEDLRSRLAAGEPRYCRLYGGELASD